MLTPFPWNGDVTSIYDYNILDRDIKRTQSINQQVFFRATIFAGWPLLWEYVFGYSYETQIIISWLNTFDLILKFILRVRKKETLRLFLWNLDYQQKIK